MPSFDIVSKVELQEVSNAVNNALKSVAQRYDFRGAKVELELDQKDGKIHMLAEDKMKLDALREMFMTAAAGRNIDLKTFKFSDAEPAANAAMKREAVVQQGIEQPICKTIVKHIKDAKLKVQASIQGDEVRVTAKKIDDLQEVMTLLRNEDFGLPLQFVNMKR